MRFIQNFTFLCEGFMLSGFLCNTIVRNWRPLKDRQSTLEHSTIGIALDLYLDMMPGMHANAVEQVDAAIKAAKKATEK